MRWLLLIVLVCSCDRKPAPPKNEFEAFERKWVSYYKRLTVELRREGRVIADKDIPTSYRAVFIGPSGVFVDRKLLATLTEIDAKHAELVAAIDADMKMLPSVGMNPVVTFQLDVQPASVAIAALRLFAGREMIIETVREDPEAPWRASEMLCGGMTLRDKPSANKERPPLSILMEADQTWIGISSLQEFWSIPITTAKMQDVDRLYERLKVHKASELFAERMDIELAATAGTSSDVFAVLDVFCKAGFVDVAVLPKDQLTAVPKL